ncbi:MAG: ABC transporter permease [bacterium]|nr:ABC transporter permease [bacterium]
MRLRDTLHTAIIAITTNGRRSALTMLGIIIGVGSVVLMTAVGASMEELILGQISSLGSKSMVIFPGQQAGPGGAVATTGSDKLTFEDIEVLQKLSAIESISPIVLIPGKVTYGREQVSPMISGVVPNYFKNQDVTAARGRIIESRDIEGARSVAVLGKDSAIDLFGVSDPLGQKVKINDRSFTVIGILEPVGSQFFQNFDERIFVPLSTAKAVTSQKYVNFVTLQASESFDVAISEVKSVLRRRHDIQNPEDDSDKDDFIVRSSAQASEILGSVSLGITMFITMIAGISLIVGGIGIMNIMLVAVTERTREIGLRKAVGARKSDVLLQFLIEAVLLTLIAGVIGLVLGFGLSALIAAVLEKFFAAYTFAYSIPAMGLAMAMAASTGLIFGIYPARKAANLSPMTALRYE